MRRSESSSVLQRYNNGRKSSFAGGRTASASMIGLLTLKSSSSIKEIAKKEKSTWSRIFSPLSFGFDKKEKDHSGYSLSRRRTHEYSKSCPNFQNKGSLRPSPNTQVRNTSRTSSKSSNKNNVNENINTRCNDDTLGLDDLSSSIFEPVISVLSKNNTVTRVKAFSGREAGSIQKGNNASNDLQILRFHDGISGKTYKFKKSKSKIFGNNLADNYSMNNNNVETNFIELDSKTTLPMFNKDEYTINRNICTNNALKNKDFVQGDIPYCDSILYLDNPRIKENDTSFSKLHDNIIRNKYE